MTEYQWTLTATMEGETTTLREGRW